MVIYLHGPDSYRRGKKLRELVADYKGKYATHDLLHVDLSEEPEDGWMRAKDFLNQPSMFVESKVLVLKEAAREEHVPWSDILVRELKTEKTFLLVSDSGEPHKHFSFLLKKPALFQKFGVLRGRELERFLAKEAEEAGVRFAPGAWRYFLAFVSSLGGTENPEKATWAAVSELKKLALSGGEEIEEERLKQVLRFSDSADFYGLVRGLLSGRSMALRLGALEELMAENIDPARIFNTLCYLASGSDALFLSEADIAVKSGRLDYETALAKTALRNS